MKNACENCILKMQSLLTSQCLPNLKAFQVAAVMFVYVIQQPSLAMSHCIKYTKPVLSSLQVKGLLSESTRTVNRKSTSSKSVIHLYTFPQMLKALTLNIKNTKHLTSLKLNKSNNILKSKCGMIFGMTYDLLHSQLIVSGNSGHVLDTY